MGHIVKRPSTVAGKPPRYKVEIDLRGVKMTKTHATHKEALEWMKTEEAKILNGGVTPERNKVAHTLREAFIEYLRVVGKHAGQLKRWSDADKQPLAFIDKALAAITTADILDWRNARLNATTRDHANGGLPKPVERATVRREWNTLSAIFTFAVDTLDWLDASPVPKKRKGQEDPRPLDNERRTRRVTNEDLGKIYAAANLLPDAAITCHRHRAALAMELGIETAMRMGEMASIRRSRINFDERFLSLRAEDTKTGHKTGVGRDVALSTRAVEILQRLLAASKDDRPLPMSAHELARQGTALRRKAGLIGLRGHDSRREACTRMVKLHKFHLLQLAEQTGHKDLRMLRVYFSETAAERAQLLP